MVRRVILLEGEETSVFQSENILSFYHQLILGQGHVQCIFAAGRLRKYAVPSLGHSLFNCSAVGVGVGVGAGSVKEQGFTHTGGDTDRGKWTVPAPSCSQDRGVSMKAGPPA